MRDREIGRPHGVRFFTQDGVSMFELAVDANNVIGPRPATLADIESYPVEWERDNPPGGKVEAVAAKRRGRPPKP